ncbi:MAG: HAD family hydrolase [Paludibacter sp.]|jgi:HAD superfamily hydrolase (TIGR01509 family)
MFQKAIQDYTDNNKLDSFELKAVFFDMDGVLFDSMRNHARAWTNAMTDIGIAFTEHEAYMNEGRTGHSTIDGAFNREYNRDATEDEKQEIYKLKSKYFESYGESPVMPFAPELLEKVKKQDKTIFLVTGSGQKSLLEGLQMHFPGIFKQERMVTAFDVTQGKPHPEPYLKALKKSGLKRSEVAVVENAPLGVESAKAAGLFVIAVNTGPLDVNVLWDSGADIVLDSMQELFEKWEEIFKK